MSIGIRLRTHINGMYVLAFKHRHKWCWRCKSRWHIAILEFKHLPEGVNQKVPSLRFSETAITTWSESWRNEGITLFEIFPCWFFLIIDSKVRPPCLRVAHIYGQYIDAIDRYRTFGFSELSGSSPPNDACLPTPHQSPWGLPVNSLLLFGHIQQISSRLLIFSVRSVTRCPVSTSVQPLYFISSLCTIECQEVAQLSYSLAETFIQCLSTPLSWQVLQNPRYS